MFVYAFSIWSLSDDTVVMILTWILDHQLAFYLMLVFGFFLSMKLLLTIMDTQKIQIQAIVRFKTFQFFRFMTYTTPISLSSRYCIVTIWYDRPSKMVHFYRNGSTFDIDMSTSTGQLVFDSIMNLRHSMVKPLEGLQAKKIMFTTVRAAELILELEHDFGTLNVEVLDLRKLARKEGKVPLGKIQAFCLAKDSDLVNSEEDLFSFLKPNPRQINIDTFETAHDNVLISRMWSDEDIEKSIAKVESTTEKLQFYTIIKPSYEVFLKEKEESRDYKRELKVDKIELDNELQKEDSIEPLTIRFDAIEEDSVHVSKEKDSFIHFMDKEDNLILKTAILKNAKKKYLQVDAIVRTELIKYCKGNLASETIGKIIIEGDEVQETEDDKLTMEYFRKALIHRGFFDPTGVVHCWYFDEALTHEEHLKTVKVPVKLRLSHITDEQRANIRSASIAEGKNKSQVNAITAVLEKPIFNSTTSNRACYIDGLLNIS